MSNRPLPANLDAERMVLGSALIGAEFGEIRRDLKPTDFSVGHHRWIYAAMCALHEREEPIVYTTLAEELKRVNRLAGVGGLSYITGLTAGLPKLPTLQGYIKPIRRATMLREIIRIALDSSERAFEQGDDPAVLSADIIARLHKLRGNSSHANGPHIFNANQLYTVEAPMGDMIFDAFPLPAHGLTLMVGASKGGKTVLGIQIAIAVAAGTPLFDYYAVRIQGPVLVIERDDKAGVAGIKPQVMLGGCGENTPFYSTQESPDGFGPAMAEWLEKVIDQYQLKLVLVDSYTAIRAARNGGGDIVKLEAAEVAMLDTLAKHKHVAIALIHHVSITGATRPDWTLAGSGTFAMFGGAEALINISRFQDLDSAPERLIRIRGRRSADHELVLRFHKETLNYRHVLEGTAAPLYPLLKQIQVEFGDRCFGMKELVGATGMSRASAFRQIGRLTHAGAVEKRGHGDYALAVNL